MEERLQLGTFRYIKAQCSDLEKLEARRRIIFSVGYIHFKLGVGLRNKTISILVL